MFYGYHVLPDRLREESISSLQKPITSNHENVTQTQVEGCLTRYSTRTPQNCQGCEKQDKTEERPQIRGAMTIECSMNGILSWTLGQKKRTSIKKKWTGINKKKMDWEIQIRTGS